MKLIVMDTNQPLNHQKMYIDELCKLIEESPLFSAHKIHDKPSK